MNIRRTLGLLCFVVARATADAQVAAPYRTVVDTVRDTVRARTAGDVPEGRLRHLVAEWRMSSDLGDSVGDVSGMAVLADGRVFVWDPSTPALWLINANGTSLKRIGQRGSGPGEYIRVNGIAVDRDGRLIMWDEENSRLNVYEDDGRFRASSRLPFGFCCPNNALTVDVQNRLWLRASIGGSADKLAGEVPRSTAAFFRATASGVLVDTVLTPNLPGDTPDVTATSRGGGGITMSSRTVPYATITVRAVSPLGHLVFGQGRPYVLYSVVNGKPLRIEREATPIPVSADERAELRARIEFDLRRVQPTWSWSGADVPAVKPAFSGIAVAQDGRIWVSLSVPSERYEPDPPPRQTNPPPPVHYRAKEKRWDVFESDGRYVGRIVAARRFTPYVMRGNTVWGILRDDDDVPSLVKMRIEPGS